MTAKNSPESVIPISKIIIIFAATKLTKYQNMKQIILTALLSAVCIIANAQENDDTQTVSADEVKYYHIDEPTEGSKYNWWTDPTDAGIITTNTQNCSRISVTWKKQGTLMVQETNAAGCTSGITSLKIIIKDEPTLYAEFETQALCFGEEAVIKFPEEAKKPIKFTYTFDGQERTVTDCNKYAYTLGTESGVYIFTGGTDANNVKIEPNGHASATIALPLKKLTIKTE